LVVISVLTSWAIGVAVMLLYVRSQSWTEEKAMGNGVFLIHQLLDETPAAGRHERLKALQRHTSVELALMATDEVERRVGRRPHPGERIRYEASWREEWYFLVFADGQGALAAGGVNPALPSGVFPIGAFLAIVGLPLIAGLVALRVEQQLRRVERASQALAVGELSTRVDEGHASSSELAARFNAMAERIEYLVRSRDELVQAVSHELGSPLSRLRFHMELLHADTGERHEERLHAMNRELDALDELVAELLTYVQSDELEIDRQTFDPKRPLADLAELASLEAPDDRVLEVNLSLPDGASVFADQRLFQRAVENILRNAVQHAGGTIRLELLEDEDHVRVAVHDDGPGIPEELREKVVVPFVRLRSDRDRMTGGAGLGLAIVSRIMHRHGGRVIIDRSPLGGAMVTTLWPRG
jgi:signal transduction histidine kinase